MLWSQGHWVATHNDRRRARASITHHCFAIMEGAHGEHMQTFERQYEAARHKAGLQA